MDLDAVSQAIGKALNGKRSCQYALGVYDYDRHFTNKAFAQSSHWLAEQFRQAGCVDAEVVELPADGRTRFQDWTMPLAFQCESAELRMVTPQEQLLCSRATEPRCVAQWSAPTQGTVQGQLVVLEQGKPYPPGAFVLTDKHPQEVVRLARQVQPAAFITDFVRKGYPDHRTMWINAMSEEPGLWGLLAGQAAAPVFVIPPALGRQLRQMLSQQPVMLSGHINGSVGPGTMAIATAVTPGERRDQEVVIFAHGYESGVIDNASGVAACLEAATAIGDLVKRGVLPKPKRSIRWLIVSECYGMVGFYSLRPGLAKAGIVGLYLDSVGDTSRPDYPFTLHRTGVAKPSYANSLAPLVLDRMPADKKAQYFWRHENEIPAADHMISDPMVGIVSPWLGRGHDFGAWHSSDDTPGLIDEVNMYGSSFLGAVYAYFAAAAGDAEAEWLAQNMLPVLQQELNDRVKPGEAERQAFWRWSLRRCAESAAELSDSEAGRCKVREIARQFEAPDQFEPRPATELDDPAAADRIPVRRTWGTLTFESVPADKRKFGSPRWSEAVNDAWYWADGRRSIGQIATLVSLELGQPVRKNLTGLFELAAEAGLCELK